MNEPPGAPDAWAAFEPLQVAGMFGLACMGWLMFRETDSAMLWRDLTLSPWSTHPGGSSGWQLSVRDGLPVLAADLVAERWAVYVAPQLTRGDRSGAWGGWQTTGEAVLAGVALAVILVFRSQQSLDFIYFRFWVQGA